jgi:hypothetical protein
MTTTCTPAGSGAAIALRLTTLLDRLADRALLPHALHHHAISEAWFSDHLAWLLDPRADHGLGPRFAEAFLRRVAQIRTHGHPIAGHPAADHPAAGHRYHHRGKFLRWGNRKVHGTSVTGLDLRNAAVFREFYLAQASASGRRTEGSLCDVVVLDLDPRDGLFLAVENKLFTTNHRGQLERYYDTIEKRYQRARVLEYVYLTLLGDAPVRTATVRSRRCDRTWVRVSWLRDVLPVIESMVPDQPRLDAHELTRVLRWLRDAVDGAASAELAAVLDELTATLVSTAGRALVAELQLLGDGAPGEWSIRRMSRTRVQLRHGSRPQAPLHLSVQPDLDLALSTRCRGRRRREKLIVPLGANPDQVVHMMRLAAREVYPLHFGEAHGRYRGATVRTSAHAEAWDELREVAGVVGERWGELRMLLRVRRVASSPANQGDREAG